VTKVFEIDLPNYYSELTETLDAANKILTTAVDDARTLFHTPVVSSYDGKIISSRVMVLREFNLENRKMRFHTDHRATKINEFSFISSATVIGYDPNLKIQIKLQGEISTHHDDQVTKEAWNDSTSRSKKCYSVKGGSSKAIDDPAEYDIKEFNAEDGYRNFAVLIFKFDTLEFLFLKSTGHRRAIHKWEKDLKSSWLVP
tara:strand:- start:5060 stop:5659 length:600 start_codon:yes stop_codon:yes gene_type:complete